MPKRGGNLKSFCCETYNGLVEEFQTLVKRESKKLPALLRSPYIAFADGLANHCAVCGVKLASQVVGGPILQESAPAQRPVDELKGLHIVTKEEYRGDKPFDSIRPGLIICPNCYGGGKTGEAEGIPVACMVCLGQGTLNGRSQIQRAIVAVKGRKISSSDLKDVASSLRAETERETNLAPKSE